MLSCISITFFLDLRNTGLNSQDDNNDNSSITYVAEDSISGFGDYDYDDYYDDEEVETEPEAEEDTDSVSEPIAEAEGSGETQNQDKGLLFVKV